MNMFFERETSIRAVAHSLVASACASIGLISGCAMEMEAPPEVGAIESELTLGSASLWVDNYGYDAGGWRVEQHPRLVADVNADGREDVVGFGNAGAYVSLSTGTKFKPPALWISNYGYDAGGWRVDRHPRFLADVNADNRADIVGFGEDGAWVSLSTGTSFKPPELWSPTFGYVAGAWSVERHPRFVIDVNKDRRADIVGFGDAGVYVALSNGTSFGAPTLWIGAFGYDAGGWRVENHPRELADVNADGRPDVVGFGDAGAYVSLNTGSAFKAPTLWVADYGYAAGGWRVNTHPRFLADVNKDGRADVVGIGEAGAYVSLALATGKAFGPPALWLGDFGPTSGWQPGKHVRFVRDLDADKRADIIGFGDAGVYISYSTGTGFTSPVLAIENFGYDAGGWRVESHPRLLGKFNLDSKVDIVGFGNAGAYVSISN